MTQFRPCIDLHEGRVKQIVGGTLTDAGAKENFVSDRSAAEFASMYNQDGLNGGHVIQLGPGNQAAAQAALAAFPGGLQIGGGINASNARDWIDRGASQVIVTSFLFDNGRFSEQRLCELTNVVSRNELVIDLSCRKKGDGYYVTTNRWQTISETRIDGPLLERLSASCSEFLVHAADVEGLCLGIEEDVVRLLGGLVEIPCTYAGGAKEFDDLSRISELSRGKLDLTFGSALDIFGGSQVKYEDCVAFNHSTRNE